MQETDRDRQIKGRQTVRDRQTDSTHVLSFRTSVYRRRVAMWFAIGISMCWIFARSLDEGAFPASLTASRSFFCATSLNSSEFLPPPGKTHAASLFGEPPAAVGSTLA